MRVGENAIIVISAACLALASGCARAPVDTPPERVTMAMQDFVGYGPFYLAKDKGFDKEEGIDIVFIDEQLDSARRDAFKQKMLDCEAGTLDLLIAKRSHGAPVVAVMEIDRSYGADGIVAAGGITGVRDLAGRKVALARDDVGETFLSYLLRREGMALDKVVIVAKAPEDVAQAFLDGEADAAVTWEPQLSKARARAGANVIITSKDAPGIIVDVLNVREDIVKGKPHIVRALMRSWFKALKSYRERPLEASGTIARHYRMEPDEYRKAVEGLLWIDHAGQDDDAEQAALAGSFGEVAALKYEMGKIAAKPSAEGAIDTRLLKDLYKEGR